LGARFFRASSARRERVFRGHRQGTCRTACAWNFAALGIAQARSALTPVSGGRESFGGGGSGEACARSTTAVVPPTEVPAGIPTEVAEVPTEVAERRTQEGTPPTVPSKEHTEGLELPPPSSAPPTRVARAASRLVEQLTAGRGIQPTLPGL
jgi:hypothetical protein